MIDINFASDGYYPVYHSVYETFELVDELVDPGFYIHQSGIRISIGFMVRNIRYGTKFNVRRIENLDKLASLWH